MEQRYEDLAQFGLDGMGGAYSGSHAHPINHALHLSAGTPQYSQYSQSSHSSLVGTAWDKDVIYGHPLFPLIALLFQKCELATLTPGGGDVCSSDSFSDDIIAFSQQVQSEQQMFSWDPELDHLVVQAVQVLHFHLLELEKVHQLCHDFCRRYIGGLRGKMPADLVADAVASPDHGGGGEQILWSKDGADAASLRPKDGNTSHGLENGSGQGDCLDPSSPFPSNEGGRDPKQAKVQDKRRGMFPKASTTVLRAWLFQHLSHPYPSEEQKKQLTQDTGLTILQVNNWFINARRRIVQPMIDQSNAAGPVGGVAVAVDGQWHYL